jgi:glycosyltransferase involved in cell wall biosynthesis
MDIVHTHSSKAGILGRIAAKLAGVPVIIHTVHGWSFHDKMSRFKKKLYVSLERLASGFCDRMIAVTNLDIEKGLAEGIGSRPKYVIIRSGIDFGKFQNYDREKVSQFKNIYNGKKIIGTVGRLSEQKNLLDFLRIAKMLIYRYRISVLPAVLYQRTDSGQH